MKHGIGLDLGGTNLKYGIASEDGTILHSGLMKSGSDVSGQRVVDTMADAAEECLRVAKEKRLEIGSIGVGCPGSIDIETGRSLGPTAHIPDWEGMPIAEQIRARCRLPVFADNDANTMAYAEYRYGAGRGCRILVGVTLGTGVGGGIVIDGEIYHGGRFNAAEIGHVVVVADGHACSCGNRGCMELYCGAKAITRDTLAALEKGRESSLKSMDNLDPKAVFEAYENGDALAKEIVERVVFYLSAGLTSVVNVLNPDVLVIGGGISQAGYYLVDLVREQILSRVMKSEKKFLKIARAELVNEAGLLGSALMGLHRLEAGEGK